MSAVKRFLLGALALGAFTLSTVPAIADENEEAKAPLEASTSPVNTSAAVPDSPRPPLAGQLELLVAGLQMPSETDAPIRVFWSNEGADEPKPADFARMAGLQLKGDEPVETRSLFDLLDVAATEETWMSEDEKKTARRFADLRAFLNANFAEIHVLSFGTTEKQIVVVGKLENGFVGLVTLVVET